MVKHCGVLSSIIARSLADAQVRWYQLCTYIIINMFHRFSDFFTSYMLRLFPFRICCNCLIKQMPKVFISVGRTAEQQKLS